ncbi:MAG: hypothetical protein ABIY55_31495 [Kofleriaceae bacterium]
MNTRRFKLHTHLTLPLELLAGPGAAHTRCNPGEVVELDAERCRIHDRFLRGRIRAGDLSELEREPAASPTPSARVAPEHGKA